MGFWHPYPPGPGVEEKYNTSGIIPFKNNLYQNTPNPASNHTIIKYSIAKKGNVLLEVYNTAGQRVATLVNEEQMPGIYKVTLQNLKDQIPAGIYFYRLKTGDYERIKKLVIIH
ncbi:MAG: T9SS type A sorting domain-containing protein [bacterium]